MPFTGAKIRQDFIDYFLEQGHTFVPSSSLVPGGDQTLLFTNAGMVQFKDVFLGTDNRPYTRAANSQKCMRVAGKHNDLDDVGRDDTHHTFFEMLGNWSFGDYYKKEAITWAWDLLTSVWKLPKEQLWVTCFRDDRGNIPEDSEAATEWLHQPGLLPEHVLYFGRKDNFWEMAEKGPCGPCSEIHMDRGLEYCDRQGTPGHVCTVNGDCKRFLELWNLVFIQYNRLGADELEPLPARHVDTGMGLERIVSVMQDVPSNYSTDLFRPMMDCVQELAGHDHAQRQANLTPYRVIADHTRAASFLIADGVVPGNTGRNYVCRMIIRRAARFGSKIGLDEPFLAQVADKVIENYGEFYSELVRNRPAILDALTREEVRFQRTLDSGLGKLEDLIRLMDKKHQATLNGESAFDLYATFGLPLEITKDILGERQLNVDEAGFHTSMEKHRLASGAGEIFGEMNAEDVDIYRNIFNRLIDEGKLTPDGVRYDPYESLTFDGNVLALVKGGNEVSQVAPQDKVEILMPETCLYVESGGQVSDTGFIRGMSGEDWEIRIEAMRKPAAGIIVHEGFVTRGTPRVGDRAVGFFDDDRRHDIMRNHTATHLLHHQLRSILGDHVRQAGSLVAPDRLRFDFTHPEALTPAQLEAIQNGVNEDILQNLELFVEFKPLQQAIEEGAMALFGEKYGETVRNILIGPDDLLSNELCGGTHVKQTGDIGMFLILSEGSAAAGIRRIEAVTGRGAYELVQHRFRSLGQAASLLAITPDLLAEKINNLLNEYNLLKKQLNRSKQGQVQSLFEEALNTKTKQIKQTTYLTAILSGADADSLRLMVDRFRQKYPTQAVIALGSDLNDKPLIITAISDDLVKQGLNAGELAKTIAIPLGGSGGGRPNLAQAGGKEVAQLDTALQQVEVWLNKKLS